MNKFSKLLAALLLGLLSTNAGAKSYTVCSDDDWFPYTFIDNSLPENKAVGIHTDIVRKAIENTGNSVQFEALPWKRCMRLIQAGKVDAVISASYSDKRAAFAYYPDDGGSAKKSAGRIDQVEYVLVTRSNEAYDFNGDWTTIPQPVGVGGLGSSISKMLKQQGLTVLENNTKTGGLLMLRGKRVNALVFNSLQAEDFNTRGQFQKQLKIHKIPLKSKSYHIVFSKKGRNSPEQRNQIWAALAKLRADKALMLSIVTKYYK